MRRLRLSRQAFTMAELMMGIFVLVIGIGSLMSAFVNCIWLNEQAAHITTATSHAEYTLEEIRNTTFADIPTTDWTAWTVAEGLNTLPQENIVVSTAGTDPLTVIVTVNWAERGRNTSESLTTKVTQ